MAWTDTGRKAEQGVLSGTTIQLTLNSTAASSLIAVGTSASGSTAPSVSVSDNVNGSYGTAIISRFIGTNRATLHVFPNNAGGNLTITATRTVSGTGWMAVHEFAGGATTTPLSATVGTSTVTAGTTIGTGSTTPADANCLLIAVVSHAGSGTISENAAGQGFTLSNEEEDTGSPTGEPGSFVWKLLSGGSGVAQSHSWTLGASSDAAAGIAAFKPAAPPIYAQTKFRIYTDTGSGLGEAA